MINKRFLFEGLFVLFCVFPYGVKASDVNGIISDTISLNKLCIKGKVKLFKEFIHFAVDNNGTIQSGEMAQDSDFVVKSNYKTNRCYIFDINGKNTQTNQYWSPSQVFTIQKNTFQGKKLLRSNTEYRFSDGIKHSKVIYSYNEKGLISSAKLYNVYGRLASKYLYKYDTHNNIIWERKVDGDGEIESTKSTEYKYEGGNLVFSKEVGDYTEIKKIKYDTKGLILEDYYQWGELVWDSFYEYNNLGQRIKGTCKNSKGDIKYYSLYEYNDNGELLKKENHFSDGRNQTWIYDIEKHGYTLTTTKDGVLTKKEVYVDNNIIEYYDGKNTYEYKYTFDSKGNWIKAIEEKNSIPTYIKVRTIQYF